MAASFGYEYRIEDRSEAASLNELGRDGWELVGIDSADRLYFKRPLPSWKDRITLEQRAAVLGSTGEGGSE